MKVKCSIILTLDEKEAKKFRKNLGKNKNAKMELSLEFCRALEKILSISYSETTFLEEFIIQNQEQ